MVDGNLHLIVQWLRDLPEVFSGFLIPLIAVLAYRIDRRQVQIGSDQLRLSLFEKRYAVYQALVDHLKNASNLDLSFASIRELYQETPQREFLFGADVKILFEQVEKKTVELLQAQVVLDQAASDEERGKGAERVSDLQDWFFRELREVNAVFSKYLRIK